MLRLLNHLFEQAKDNLLVASPTNFAPLQGEANAYRDLARLITTPPLTEEQRKGGF